MKFSSVYVVIRNLDVRTYDNPAIGGIDLAYAVQCRLENVFIKKGGAAIQTRRIGSAPVRNERTGK